MTIEFKLSTQQHETREEIFFEGRKIGDMYHYPRSSNPYHACLTGHAPGWLIQGFGDTKDESLKNAFIAQRVDIEIQKVFMAELEAKLFPVGQ